MTNGQWRPGAAHPRSSPATATSPQTRRPPSSRICREDRAASSLLYHPGMSATDPEPIGLPPGAVLQAAGEDEAKYSSRNIVVRNLIAHLLRTLRRVAGSTDGVWVDVGIGEGLALEAMQVHAGSLVGVEYRHDKLSMALERIPSLSGVQADAGMLPFADGSTDIVTCLEVLEHLETPDAAVAELARVCRGHCVVSVPWEPFFRLGNFCREKTSGIGATTQSMSSNFDRLPCAICSVDPSMTSPFIGASPGSSQLPRPSSVQNLSEPDPPAGQGADLSLADLDGWELAVVPRRVVIRYTSSSPNNPNDSSWTATTSKSTPVMRADGFPPGAPRRAG